MSTSNVSFDEKTTGDQVVAAFADRVKGRIFVVTGASSGGIGATTLTSLAKGQPEALVVAGRDPTKFQAVVDDIKRIDANIKVVVLALDLGSFASTRSAAASLLANADLPRIDALINNAGIMATPFALTADGIEQQFHVDHVGHFLFTNLLLPKLRAAPEPRVVNVSSSGCRFGTGDYSDVNWEKTPYDAWTAYGQAKTANVLFSVALTERGIHSVAPHPGRVGTDLGRYLTMELYEQMMARLQVTPNMESLTYVKNLEEGCSTTLVAALDPKLPSGLYMRDCQVPDDTAPHVLDKSKAAKLWELSNKLTGENFP